MKESNTLKGNLAMLTTKVIAGLNENAMRFLLPRWMSSYSGVFLRIVPATAFYWLVALFRRSKPAAGERQPNVSEKLLFMALGAFFVFGYMWTLLEGLTYTTPISSSIFISLEPVFVFLINFLFFHYKFNAKKFIGIMIGLAGALICILTQQKTELATDPFRGNMFCLGSALLYSLYLILEKKLLNRGIVVYSANKWVFTGASLSACVCALCHPWYAPVLEQNVFSTPFLVLLFVVFGAGFFGYILVTIGLKDLSPVIVAIYGYVLLIVATITSYILGQDVFDWWQLLAIVLIVVSVYLVEIASNKPTPSRA